MIESTPFEVAFFGSHSLVIPHEKIEPFRSAGQKRIKVVASFEERRIEFHAALQKRGNEYRIVFGKKLQKDLGVFPNDLITLQFFEDKTTYGVEMPEELRAVFNSEDEAFKIFEGLTDGKKRSIIYMVLRYKSSQTRIDKSLLLCDNLKRGIRKPTDLLKTY